MKKLLLFLSILTIGFATKAQQLAADQNPNYKQSENKYTAQVSTTQGSTATMNTTIGDTYKAYDFQTAKAERKTERRNFRRERQQNSYYNNGYNGFNNYNPYNNYYNPYNNFYRRRW